LRWQGLGLLNFKTVQKMNTEQNVDGLNVSPAIAKPMLAAVLDPNVSMRCGKSSCEFYNKHNKVSGCHKFDDRRNCSLSMKQRRKAKNKSKKRDSVNWYGC